MKTLQNLHRRRIKKSRQAPSQDSTNSPENSWTRVGCHQHRPTEINEQLFCCNIYLRGWTSALLSETRCCSTFTPCARLIYIESQIHNSCSTDYKLYSFTAVCMHGHHRGRELWGRWGFSGFLSWISDLRGHLDSGLAASIFTEFSIRMWVICTCGWDFFPHKKAIRFPAHRFCYLLCC